MADSATGEQARSLEGVPVRVMSAKVGLVQRLRTLWERRELQGQLIVSDIRIKYKNSALGIFWSMLSPAMMLGIYFLVFSVFLKNGIPHFAIYLFSGLVVWNMYMNAVTGATGVIVQRGSLVKKVSFPREVLPLSYVGASVVYFAIQLAVLFIFVFAFGHAPQWSWMWLLPISFASLLFFTAAVGVVMSGVNVYMRDMGHLIEVLLQLWFWGTPICYSYENSIAPHLAAHGLSSLYFFNPITPIVLTFQRVFYNSVTVTSTTTHQILHVLPSWSLASYFYLNVLFLALSIFLFLIAESLFGRLELNFESEL